MAVVKANAYGHGAMECARRLEAERARTGLAWRCRRRELNSADAGRYASRSSVSPAFGENKQPACLQHDLVPAVYRLDMIEAFDRAAGERSVSR